MRTVYVYVLDTLADWELGYVTSELNSKRFFKQGAQDVLLTTVGTTNAPVKTMGGLTVVPDCIIDDIVVSKKNILILPGANTWSDPVHHAVLEKASDFLAVGATVCVICGATTALADLGLLNHRPHTSNGPGFLEMFSANYQGQSYYIDEPSVADSNLITASSTGGLLWAKQILARLDVFQPDTLEAWYDYFRTGKPEYFYALMNTLQARGS